MSKTYSKRQNLGRKNRRPAPQKHTKDPPFGYLGIFNLDFFRHYETFFENFLIAPTGPPSNF